MDPMIIIMLVMFSAGGLAIYYLYLALMNELPWQKKNKP